MPKSPEGSATALTDLIYCGDQVLGETAEAMNKNERVTSMRRIHEVNDTPGISRRPKPRIRLGPGNRWRYLRWYGKLLELRHNT